MQRCPTDRLNGFHFAEHPQHEVKRMYRLIDQCAATVERPGPAPARIGVIVWRAVPLHSRVYENRLAQRARIHSIFHRQNIRLATILEENSQLHPSFACFSDKRISAFDRNIDGLFRKHVQAVSRRRYSLLGVKSGRAAYGHKLHGAMSNKLIKIAERFSAVFTAQAANFLRIGAEDRSDFNARNRARSTRMRLADISPADQSNVRSHLLEQKRAIP